MSAAPPPPPAVGRLAPSPTGLLHLGHARSFLLAWWSVRSRGGRMLLRLEDLDTGRVRPEYVEACLGDLAWLGLDWDGPVDMQSSRARELRAVADDLAERGLAFPCVCTRAELAEAIAAPHAGEHVAPYPGTCRGRYASLLEAERASGRRAALRLVVPDVVLELEDALHGPFSARPSAEVGDFPLTSRDGQVAYQLAVVLDDARAGVTEVLRGEDLLASTGRQALLQRILGLPHPRWIHVPLVVDPGGERLAKRTDALSLAALREQGVPPGAIVAWVARSAGLEPPGPLAAAEVLPHFDLARLPRAPVPAPSPASLLAAP